MYCKNCGIKIDDQASFCSKCGTAQQNTTILPSGQSEDKYVWLWGVLSFFIPIVGLVLYLVWKDTKPKDAKYAGIGALIGFIIVIVIIIICLFLFASVFRFIGDYHRYFY